MRIVVLLDRARLFRWHLELLSALQNAGHTPTVQFRDTSEPLPTSLTTILDFDRARTRSGLERFSTHLAPEAFAPFARRETAFPELCLDLSTASLEAQSPGRTLRPLYDGSPKDYALFHALLNGEAPRLWVSDTSHEGGWNIGWPAIETPARFARSFDETTSRLVEGLLRAVRAISAGERPAFASHGMASRRPGSILSSAGRFAAQRSAGKLQRARDRIIGDEPKWHVAWRKLEAPAPAPRPGPLDLNLFQILPSGNDCYFADPFAILRDQRLHVFVEEVPEVTAKGHISHFTIGSDGVASVPRPVLEEPHHLSYPFVFSRDGAIWMLPEASKSGGLDLYRATDFPNHWEKAARLIDKPLHDATLFSHGGFLWIAAAETVFQSSSWDALSLYWAENLLGPWHPHARNPVLVDAASARPAGALFEAGIDLLRPAQDCSEGYGGRLTFKRITRLFPEQYEEETIGTLTFAGDVSASGPHTLSRCGLYEFVDFFARPSALKRRVG